MSARAEDEDVQRARRLLMVERQLRERGIEDERVLEAMSHVPRHAFVPEHLQELAYSDRALPIGYDQTISQPYVVALMLEALRLDGSERVLDLGTGSGYQAALLGRLARSVHSVEIVRELLAVAAVALAHSGVTNVELHVADGNSGFSPGAPYDAIAAAVSAPSVPPELLEQLRDGGRLVMPVGEGIRQVLTLIRKQNGDIETKELIRCAFVPLITTEARTPSNTLRDAKGTGSNHAR